MCNAVALHCPLFQASTGLVYISKQDTDLEGETNALHVIIDQPWSTANFEVSSERAMPRDKTRNTPITLPGFVVSCAHGVDGLLRRKPIECVHCRRGIVNQPPQPNISAILHPVSLPPSLYFSRFLALRAWSLSIWKQRTITILKSISVLVGIAINWFVWDNALYRRRGRPPRSHLFISAVRTE